MCVALTGFVTEIKGDLATVDFNGNIVTARGASLIKVVPGDRVLVHAGMILQKVSDGEAKELEELMKDVGAF